METSENIKIPVADFCSKLGGILNLWSGITVILILELMEVMIRIMHKSLGPGSQNVGPIIDADALPPKNGGSKLPLTFQNGLFVTSKKGPVAPETRANNTAGVVVEDM